MVASNGIPAFCIVRSSHTPVNSIPLFPVANSATALP